MSYDADQQAVSLLAMRVERQIGLHYSAPDRSLLEGKLRDHADLQGFDSLWEFYRSLQYDDPDGARMEALVDALIVGETYFFRERPALERIVERVRERDRRGLRTRIWSAACATGEEILSLAALIGAAGLLDAVELLASDVSDRQLARAQAGEHTRRALRAVPEGFPPWIRVSNGVAEVDPRLRSRVRWRKVNLLDAPAVAALGSFDVILCRNVLIYFDDATVIQVIATLTDALSQGGALFIGTAESLLRFPTRLQCVEQRGAFLYQLPTAPP